MATRAVILILCIAFFLTDCRVRGLRILRPLYLRNNIVSTIATFGPPAVTFQDHSAQVVVGHPMATGSKAGCGPPGSEYGFENGSTFFGKIVLIARGHCTFRTKVAYAQSAGAIGVVIVDKKRKQPDDVGSLNDDTEFSSEDSAISINMMTDDGHGNEINIPVELISYRDGMMLATAVDDQRNDQYVLAELGLRIQSQNFYH